MRDCTIILIFIVKNRQEYIQKSVVNDSKDFQWSSYFTKCITFTFLLTILCSVYFNTILSASFLAWVDFFMSSFTSDEKNNSKIYLNMIFEAYLKCWAFIL